MKLETKVQQSCQFRSIEITNKNLQNNIHANPDKIPHK